MAKQGFETSVEHVEMYVDGSGAATLIRVDGLLFSLSLAAIDAGPTVHCVNAKSSTSGRRIERAAAHARSVYQRDILDHLTPAYIEKNRAMYA